MKMSQPVPIMMALVLVVLAAACGKKSSSAPIPIEQAPQVLTESFKDAKPETAATAKEIVNLLQERSPESLEQINEFAAKPDLSDAQRAAAYRVAAAVHQKMVQDAARGDKKAEEALEKYRATK